MNKKYLGSALMALGILLTLLVPMFGVGVYAQQDVAREDTVIFDIDESEVPDPHNFNWMLPGVRRNQGAHQAMWEPLFILNYETGEIQPWLGVSFVPNETQDVWTLTLRDGIKWSDGEAFNADDVVFTVNLLLGDETQTLGEAANTQQWVASVEKIDDLTVQFNLTAPNPRYQLDYWAVRIWGGPVILPEHVWADKDPFTFTFYDEEQGWPIGTGPYKLVSANPTEFVWDRDDNWWGAQAGFLPLPEPLRLIWIIAGPEETKALLMADHQLDSAMNITLGAFEAILDRNPNAITWHSGLPFAWADPCPRQLSFNMALAPWDNANLRKAVSLIIDRNQIVEISYEGTTTTSNTMFVQYGGMDPYINAVVDAGMGIDPAGHPDEGKAMIEAEGYTLNGDGLYEKDGNVLAADFIVDEGTIEYRRVVEVVVEQLRAAGIDATMHPVTSATWQEMRALGTLQASFNWDTCGSVNEPWRSLNTLNTFFYVPVDTRASDNFPRWNTEGAQAYSAIVDQIGSLPLGDPQVVDLVVQAYQYVNDETPVIPLVQASKLVPFDTTYWVGWPTADNNYNHPATWWFSTHQIIHNLHKAG